MERKYRVSIKSPDFMDNQTIGTEVKVKSLCFN